MNVTPIWAEINHRLYGKDHSRLHSADCFVFRIVGNIGWAVEKSMYAMSSVGSNCSATVGACDGFNYLSEVAEEGARFAGLDRLIESLPTCFQELCGLVVYFADWIGAIDITVVSIIIAGNVYVDNVSGFELSLVWNPMANDFVHRRANGFGKAAIAQWRRIGIPLYGFIVNYFIELVCSDSGSDMGSGNVKYFPGEPTDGSHFLLFFRGKDPGWLARSLQFLPWDAVWNVFRTRNVIGNYAFR